MKTQDKIIQLLAVILMIVFVTDIWAQRPPREGIQTVSPSSADQGQENILVTITLKVRDAPPDQIEPLRVKIGTLEGKRLTRNGLVVTAVFDIPANEPPGKKDVSITFPGLRSRGRVYVEISKTGAFDIQGDSQPISSKYVLVDTGQIKCYSSSTEISAPQPGEAYYGQDAQYQTNAPSYLDNGDGTITDLNTGLMWQKDPGGKKTYQEAVDKTFSFSLAGYTDWRLPTIKELYSLIDFSGTDTNPDGPPDGSTTSPIPFIDTNCFDFQYGDESAGERIIDAQYWSSTEYVSTTMMGNQTAFGVNFADGRIKGYGIVNPRGEMKQFVRYVRGNPDYGKNVFKDNGDGTIIDAATGLMWMQIDSAVLNAGQNGDGQLNWAQALEWAENLVYAGYSDWRLPNAKELQSIVDYTRSPSTTGSAAIDPLFSCTPIINEGWETDFAAYWTSTTHANDSNVPGRAAAYIAFGRGLGYMEMPPNSGNLLLLDVHGAGSQRSDPKVGDPSDFPYGRGPQGDVIRIFNLVRLVRGTASKGHTE
jgi:hypothetical protein